VARATHATIGSQRAAHIENVGKQPLQQSGKYRVNENDEKKFAGSERAMQRTGSFQVRILDCFVAFPPRNDSLPHSPSSREPAKQSRIKKTPPGIDCVGTNDRDA
jgi:hypothetical protein